MPAAAEAPMEPAAAPDPTKMPYDYKAPSIVTTEEKDGKKVEVTNFPDAEGAKAGTWATPSSAGDGDEKNGAMTPAACSTASTTICSRSI